MQDKSIPVVKSEATFLLEGMGIDYTKRVSALIAALVEDQKGLVVSFRRALRAAAAILPLRKKAAALTRPPFDIETKQDHSIVNETNES